MLQYAVHRKFYILLFLEKKHKERYYYYYLYRLFCERQKGSVYTWQIYNMQFKAIEKC